MRRAGAGGAGIKRSEDPRARASEATRACAQRPHSRSHAGRSEPFAAAAPRPPQRAAFETQPPLTAPTTTSYRSFKDESATSASTIDTIQNRTTIFCSSQPAFSKW